MKTLRRGRVQTLAFLFVVVSIAVAPRLAANLTAAVAAPSAQVYINPTVTPIQAFNTTFQVQVKVANIAPFNTYDIQVAADQSVISATGLSISGNIFSANASKPGTPFELTHCINGAGQGCAPTDGPGIVHSAFSDFGFDVNASGSGLLFTITYNVTSNKIYTPITMQNATTIIAIAGKQVDRLIANGRYGTGPDFALSAAPSSLTIILGSTGTTTIGSTSLYNFIGTVNVTAESPATGISVSLNPNQTVLHANEANSTVLTVDVNSTVAVTTYTITVTGVSGNLTRSVLVPLKVVPVPDFTVGFSPAYLQIPQSRSNRTTVTVTSENNFTGTVKLKVDAPLQTTASFDQTNNSSAALFVPNGGVATATLTVTTQASATPFRDNFNITATSGNIVHTQAPGLVVEPPPPDFNVTTPSATISIQAGDSKSITVGVTSQEYYVGRVFVIGATPTGLGFTFDPGNFSISSGQTKSTTLRITSNSTTTPGDHVLTLVVLGINEFTGASTRHSVQLTITVTAPPVTPVATVTTFLGLQESAFFALIITGIVVLAGLGVFESKRSRGRRKNSILQD